MSRIPVPPPKENSMKAIVRGADHVIDYTQEDFTRNGQRYDLIFDSAGYRSLSHCRRVLGSNGILVMCGAGNGRSSLRIMARTLDALLVSRFGRQKLVPLMANRNRDDLIVLKELIEAGKVIPVIDRELPVE